MEVGKVNLGFFNRIIIDDVMMYDQQGDSLIYASRLSAKIDYMAATQGKISVSSAQIFGLRANLYRQTAKSPANFQFVLDSLASKDTTQHKPLDLHIGSLIIRRGAIAYNQRDVAPRSGVFSPQHIRVSELSSHILLNHVTDNSIDLLLKKLSLRTNQASNYSHFTSSCKPTGRKPHSRSSVCSCHAPSWCSTT